MAGKYNIIYADPPWSYKDKALAGKRGAGCKYNTMSDVDIGLVPVHKMAANDALLFMWATYPKLIEGTCTRVMRWWGFEPKTVAFVWVKYHKNCKPFMGMGNWTRANSEICILGVRGKPTRASAGVRQIIETYETYVPDVIQSVPEGHSKKPGVVRNRIVELCGNLPRIELFARQETLGWHTMGDELGKKI